jgi:hypothetical protein
MDRRSRLFLCVVTASSCRGGRRAFDARASFVCCRSHLGLLARYSCLLDNIRTTWRGLRGPIPLPLGEGPRLTVFGGSIHITFTDEATKWVE